MLRKLYLVPVLALFLLPAVAHAQFEQGNWELTLSGTGSNDQDFRTKKGNRWPNESQSWN